MQEPGGGSAAALPYLGKEGEKAGTRKQTHNPLRRNFSKRFLGSNSTRRGWVGLCALQFPVKADSGTFWAYLALVLASCPVLARFRGWNFSTAFLWIKVVLGL